jgi:cysteinyl-tRNA synthetase
VTESGVPAPILALADARQRAREARDWAEADRLRGEIEAAGWKVVDQATSYRLSPARPPDIIEGGRVRHGSSAAVPSRLAEPRTGLATIVLVATDPADLVEMVGALRMHAPHGSQIVIVSDDPSETSAEALDRLAGTTAEPSDGGDVEVVWLRAGSGLAAAANAGIRRARAAVIVLLDPGLELTGDAITPLVRALEDETIAVAGPWGSVTTDLRRFADVPAGDADVVSGECLAFRVTDYLERGPLDDRLRLSPHLGTWWSLTLRDEGDEERPRRAVCVAGLPLSRRVRRDGPPITAVDRVRLEKRGFYRVFDQFGHRRDLLGGPPP